MRDIDWQLARDYYEAGHSRKECHEAFGISDWDWHAAVGRGDIAPRVSGEIRRASKLRELIGRLRAEGLSYKAISRRLGVSKATVAYHRAVSASPSIRSVLVATTGTRFRRLWMKGCQLENAASASASRVPP